MENRQSPVCTLEKLPFNFLLYHFFLYILNVGIPPRYYFRPFCFHFSIISAIFVAITLISLLITFKYTTPALFLSYYAG